jgi:hypothetical protein
MKLPNFYVFDPLNRLKEKMGIALETVGSLDVLIDAARLTAFELEKLASQDGLDISLDDLKVLFDGTLAYKDSRVLLYIRDVAIYGEHEPEPRYHLSNCATLQQMREKKRFNSRYVVATNIDGTFNLNLIDGTRTRTKLTKLSVCQNCLGLLEFDGFRMNWRRPQRVIAVKSFTLERFFVQFPRSLHIATPTYNADNAPLNIYTPDFSTISASARAAVGYECQQCKINLSAKPLRKYLHVHHIDGSKSNNSSDNLKVVCFGCHSEEPAHHHMKNLPDFWLFSQLRLALKEAAEVS